jgi:ketosteroid isomerase-like protein
MSTNTAAKKVRDFDGNRTPETGLVRAMTDAMTSDDVESMVNLFAPDGEWVIVATGERFHGLDEIRQLAIRSVAGRDHPAGTGIKPTNVFTNEEGTKLCWEYMHTCVVTDKWPASKNRPAPGTKIELPIVLICDIRKDKLVRIREYFNLQTVTEPGVQNKLYS